MCSIILVWTMDPTKIYNLMNLEDAQDLNIKYSRLDKFVVATVR
jgi:hypothetical protein